jgi:hypothetical protein
LNLKVHFCEVYALELRHQQTGVNEMTTYTYQAATYNGKKCYFATRHIDGIYAGKMFGASKQAAANAFEA